MRVVPGYVLLFLASLVGGARCLSAGDKQQDAETRWAQARIAEAIDLAASGQAKEAAALLQDAPAIEIIPAVVTALERDSRASCFQVKYVLYSALAHHHAASTEPGYRILLAGAGDPDVASVCVGALAEAPVEKRPEVAERLSALLLDSVTPEKAKNTILFRLSRFTEDARRVSECIEALFDNRNNDPRLRTMAAEAMLTIGPADRAVGHFRDEDAELFLGPLGKVGTETRGSYNTDEATRKEIRALVNRALRHHSKRIVRELALQVLGPAYSHDLVVGNATEGYQFNPEFKEAFEFMARNDPDDELRNQAQEVLNTLDERLKAAIRRRERWKGEQAEQAAPVQQKDESP